MAAKKKSIKYVPPQTNFQLLGQTQAQRRIHAFRSMSSSKSHPKMRPLPYPVRNEIAPLLEKVQDIRAYFETTRRGFSFID